MFQKKKMEIISGVFDPNESWRDFFFSMLEFWDPKIVPLNQLSKDFDPKKRKFESLKTIINWRNKNYLESIEDIKENVEDNKVLN